MTEPSVEVLLVQGDQQQVQLTLKVVQGNRLANRILVVRGGAEALDFLFRSGAYAGRQDVNPRLILYDLRLADSTDIDALTQITQDPRTATIPVTVLASSDDDRLAAMSTLREHDLPLPVVVVGRSTPGEAGRVLGSLAETYLEPDPAGEAAITVEGGADGAPPSRVKCDAPPGDPSLATLCLERDLDALVRLARGAAHEFNNLFSIFVAYTEQLLKDLDLDDPRRAGAEEIFKAIGKASRLTRAMMTFSPRAAEPPAPEPPARPSAR